MGASAGGSDRDQSKAMFSSCLPPFTPRVVFGRKAAPFQFQTSGRREQVFFVSLSMKNYLKNQPPATRGFSLINGEGFSVAQERERGETAVREQTNLRAPREVANL